jgi:16S rRNA processing protein RimM
VALARLMRPQGRKGELLAELLTDLDPETQFAAGREVTLAATGAAHPAGGSRAVTIESHWMPTGKNAGRIVLKLAGCESISDAEKLAGRMVMVPSEEMPALDADTFYVADLVGCALFDGEARVGEVIAVEFAMGPDGKTRLADAAPLLEVRMQGAAEDAETVLVPFVLAHLVAVDVAAKRITMRLPEGLLEADAS